MSLIHYSCSCERCNIKELIGFSVENFSEIVALQFILAYANRVLIDGYFFDKCKEDLFYDSGSLSDHGGVVRFASKRNAQGNVEVSTKHYYFHDPRPNGSPWGASLPFSCSSCGALQTWMMVTDPNVAYSEKFKGMHTRSSRQILNGFLNDICRSASI